MDLLASPLGSEIVDMEVCQWSRSLSIDFALPRLQVLKVYHATPHTLKIIPQRRVKRFSYDVSVSIGSFTGELNWAELDLNSLISLNVKGLQFSLFKKLSFPNLRYLRICRTVSWYRNLLPVDLTIPSIQLTPESLIGSPLLERLVFYGSIYNEITPTTVLPLETAHKLICSTTPDY